MSLTIDTKTTLPGLYASPPAPLPFAPSLEIRSFLLRRERGNVLVYASPNVEADAFADVGGVARAYLNHGHEASLGHDLPGVPLFVHVADAAAAARDLTVRATFSRRHMLDDDLEVIPTPGHTPGATAYLWDNGEHRFLFTGDTIYLHEGRWIAAVLGSSDRASYIESLELIRGLDFDVLVPWATTVGQPFYTVTGEGEARERIDTILERIRAGKDH